MHRPFLAALLVASLCAWSCGGGGVPTPCTTSTAECVKKCEDTSKDTTVGCMACAGISYCGWKMTSPPLDGTCHFVDKDKPVADPKLVTDPQNCPHPPT